MSVRLEVVCIGTELLTGKVNTHTAYLGRVLETVGISIAREQTVSDEPKDMFDAFQTAWRRADVVISCGGLGPTFDDITRDVWSRVTGRRLRLQLRLVEDIRDKFRQRGLSMPPQNARQGQVLAGAEVLPNAKGTAPGQWLQMGRKVLILLPGPTRELTSMMESAVLPRLQPHFRTGVRFQKSFHMVGVPESQIDQLVRPWVKRYARIKGRTVTHGILASNSIITVKFSIGAASRAEAETLLAPVTRKFSSLLKPHMFGEDADTLPAVVGRRLSDKRKTVAVAESCTGGLVSKLITDVSGSSAYLKESVVTYSNVSKQKRLGVASSVLRRFGAVSAETAKSMAQGIRRTTKADFGVSITGVAGPGGGGAEKPVGLVYVACSGPRRTVVRRFQFNGDRDWIRHRAALMALDTLRKEI